MQTQIRIEDCRPTSYNDDMILHKLKTRNSHSKTFKIALKQYRSRIAENRLFFLRNRGSIAAVICITRQIVMLIHEKCGLRKPLIPQ